MLIVGQTVRTIDELWEGKIVSIDAPGKYNVSVLYPTFDGVPGRYYSGRLNVESSVTLGWFVVPYTNDGTVAAGYSEDKNLNLEDIGGYSRVVWAT